MKWRGKGKSVLIMDDSFFLLLMLGMFLLFLCLMVHVIFLGISSVRIELFPGMY